MLAPPEGLTFKECLAAVGASNPTLPFGQNSKMPGPSYGLPASACKRGAKLAKDRGSMCHPSTCYAKRNRYKTWRPVVIARDKHLASLEHPRWVDAFVYLFQRRYAGECWFRWHDSGDLQGLWHLENIAEVARRLPAVRFWLPTHEPTFVETYRKLRGLEPANLTIRVSADRLYEVAKWDGLTSTVHEAYGQPIVTPGRRNYECRAHDRDNQCGPCRACWSPNAHNISYPRTGPGAKGVRAAQLRILP